MVRFATVTTVFLLTACAASLSPAASTASTTIAELPTPTFVPPLEPTSAPTNTPGTPAKLEPVQATASAHAPAGKDACGNTLTYEADKAVDGQADTAWRVDQDGAGAWIELVFVQPVVVTQLNIMTGYNKVDACSGVDRFLENYIPRTLRFDFVDAGISQEHILEAKRETQTVSVASAPTQRLRITIIDSYRRLGEKAWTGERAALSEIEVWGYPGH